MKQLLFLLGACTVQVVSARTFFDGSSLFCYNDDNCGPRTWGGLCNGGNKQSPINLPATLKTISKASLYFNKDYSTNQKFILKNTGHTVQASSTADLTSTSVLQGDILQNKRYVFSQLHFHWGSNNQQGSEHTHNNKTYAMEGHFVHYSSEFNSLNDALASNQSGALSVVAVLYQVSQSENQAFNPILNVLSQVVNSGNSVQGTDLNLWKLLPQQPGKIYNYQYDGSLTTPSCNEVVLWNVLISESHISQQQLSQFRKVIDSHEEPMENNFRPIQALNNRIIRVYESQLINQ